MFTYTDPIRVDWHDEIRVFMKATQPKNAFDSLRRHLRKIMKSGPRTGEGRGFRITVDNIDELSDTLQNYSKIMFGDIAEGAAEFLFEVMKEGSQGARASEWAKIGKSAKEHMQLLAAKEPDERRNLIQRTPWFKLKKILTSGGVLQEEQKRQMKVGMWGGSYARPRTGHLHESIDYKIIYHPDRPKRRRLRRISKKLGGYLLQKRLDRDEEYKLAREMAIGFVIGPGAGSAPAPHYTDLVNDGAGPAQDMYYVPKFGAMITTKTKGRAGKGAIGKTWAGFEGKFFIENTGLWLKRNQRQLVSNVEMMARIYTLKAIEKYKDDPSVLPEDKVIRKWMHKTLQRHAEFHIKKSLRVSTDKMLTALVEALKRGKSHREKKR